MTPIERAARAMYNAVKPEWDWNDPDAELLRRMYRENARAAIAALREPDDLMVQAGAEIVRHIGAAESDEAFLNDAANTWRLMIDAAVAEREC
ncbi:hypothetical protein [Sphingobium sp. EP60837]|jgi:hypothetical protein|uniref:hypothetical protein n=1 Tax=Sphingobium sp. EP60837 TaxID=1855519 RepID=UPI0007DE07EE|nr:hypothetical protein [Sphingobium sp. EP60837]ANI78484.1 hypothetical protein EP837_02078 [Sphingobium sp. EP60837]